MNYQKYLKNKMLSILQNKDTKKPTKSNENEVYTNIEDKCKKRFPKGKVGCLVRTIKIFKIFYKGGTTKWYYELYEISKFRDDTTLRCFLGPILKDLMKLQKNIFNKNTKKMYIILKTELTLKEVMKEGW